MTTTTTKYPTKISQITGKHQQPFQDTDNLKTEKKYAETTEPLEPKGKTKTKPSHLIFENYKLNIPNDAEVRRVTIEYKIEKIGVAKDKKGKKTPSNKNTPCNLSAPKFIVTNTATDEDDWFNDDAKDSKTADKIANTNVLGKTAKKTRYFSVKGKAPKEKGEKKSVSFNVKQDQVPTSWWNSGLYVGLKFPSNSNKHEGYIRVYYVRLKVEYATPKYGIKLTKVSGGYNNEEFRLKATISNSNLTKYNPNVIITTPIGFNYQKMTGDGKITKNNNRTFTWTPKIKNRGSSSVELIFNPNVTYSTTDRIYEATFNASVPSYNLLNTLNTTIRERPPQPGTISEETDTEVFTDQDSQVDHDDRVWATLDEQFNLILKFTEEEITKYSDDGILYLNFQGYKDEHLYTNWYYVDDNGEHQLTDNLYLQVTDSTEYTFDGSFLVKNTTGDYSLKVYGLVGGESPQELIRELIISIRPPLSELSVPNLTVLELTEEELNRLGHEYVYTAQSNMTLVSTEDHIRDWHKNFRLGLFNNRIEANCTDYILFQSEDDTQDRTIRIPGLYDLETVTCEFNVDTPITITLDDTPTLVTESIPVPLEDFNIPVTLKQTGNETVNLTCALYDETNALIYERLYTIVFNAEETLPEREETYDSTDYTSLSRQQIYENASYWSSMQAGFNTSENVTVDFIYNKNYPLYILLTGDYPEGTMTENTINFNEPCIIETSEYVERETNGNYPVPIDDSVVGEEVSSEITINGLSRSTEIVFYDLPLDDEYGTNTYNAIRGVEITGSLEHSDDIVLYANLKSPTGESRQRSVVISDTDTEFSIGGMGDLWGFSTLDMVNLEDWEVDFAISNVLNENDTVFNFGDIQIILYVAQVDEQTVKCYIEGEDIAYYGVFLTDLDIPEGLETDTNYLSVDGTDMNDAYRQNIKEKTIEIEFDIGEGCDIEGSTLSLRQFTRLLVNDRDEYNRPIPKRIEFSHYSDVYWEYVMEDAFDTTLDINTYHVKAKLVIPAGTAYDRTSTTTSSGGYVDGIAAINPVITVTPTDDVIEIRETLSNQKFNIGYSGDWNGKLLEIQTSNRKVYLKTDEDEDEETDNITDLTNYVDFNSDWFKIKGEYNFEGTNCVIRTITFNERW